MISIYPLQLAFANIESMLTASGGEITPEIETAMNELKVEKEEKLQALACMVKNAYLQAKTFTSEADRLYKEATKLEANAEKYNSMIRQLLPEGESFAKDTHELWYIKSEFVEVGNPDEVPDEYCTIRQMKLPSRVKIKEAIQSGKVIPNCEIKTRFNLQIR